HQIEPRLGERDHGGRGGSDGGGLHRSTIRLIVNHMVDEWVESSRSRRECFAGPFAGSPLTFGPWLLSRGLWNVGLPPSWPVMLSATAVSCRRTRPARWLPSRPDARRSWSL